MLKALNTSIVIGNITTSEQLKAATDSILAKLVIQVAKPLIDTGINAIIDSKKIDPIVKDAITTITSSTASEVLKKPNLIPTPVADVLQEVASMEPTSESKPGFLKVVVTQIVPLIIRGLFSWITSR